MSSVSDSIVGQYHKQCTIGEGTYGLVYKAYDAVRKMDVALKKVRVDRSTDGISSTTLREIGVLKELSHPNIVKLLDVVYVINKIYLVFEHLDIDLRVFMDCSNSLLPHALIKSYAYQLLQAIDYCHSRRIVHRDIKPQNLLLNADGYIKLADFGLARSFGIPMKVFTHEVVTLWYRAPEILLGVKLYTMAVDLWSIGCIFAELFKKRPIFEGDSEIDQLFKIFRILGTPNDEVWPDFSRLPEYKPFFPHWDRKPLVEVLPDVKKDAISVLEELLQYNPTNRMCVETVLQHPYFNDARIVKVSNFQDILQARDKYLRLKKSRRSQA